MPFMIRRHDRLPDCWQIVRVTKLASQSEVVQIPDLRLLLPADVDPEWFDNVFSTLKEAEEAFERIQPMTIANF